MSRIRDLRQKRAAAIEQGRELLKRSEAEGRSVLSEDESRQYDAYVDEADKLAREIEREERQVQLEHSIQGATDAVKEMTAAAPVDDVRTKAFGKFLTRGFSAMTEAELRVLQADSAPDGGFLIAPQQFVVQLLKNVDDAVYMRQVSTKFQVSSSSSLGVPTLDTDANDANWTAELLTGSEDTAIKFGKRELRPHPLAKRTKISNKLISQSAIPIESFVRSRLAYKFAVTEEKAFLLGSGAAQPLGVFTASTDGISTSRDMSTDNTSSAITFDGLMNAKFNQKAQYFPKLSWMFHRDAIKMLSKIKDLEGRYVWEPSVRAGTPDRLLDAPFIMSEFVPNTFTTGLYVGIVGDFSNYWIADCLSMQMQRLNELYAEQNTVGFIGRLEVDGMPVLEEAFTRVKLA